MTYFKNSKYKILVTINDDGRRAVLNNGIRFTAPDYTASPTRRLRKSLRTNTVTSLHGTSSSRTINRLIKLKER